MIAHLYRRFIVFVLLFHAITVVAQVFVLQRPYVCGSIEGDVFQFGDENVIFSRGAHVEGTWHIVGEPKLGLHEGALGSTRIGDGNEAVNSGVFTLNAGSYLQALEMRWRPIAWPDSPSFVNPQGTRWVTLQEPRDNFGDTTSLCGLTLNSGAGAHRIASGSYANWTINADASLVLGTPDGDQTQVYYVENLAVNSGGKIEVLGPVELRVKNWTNLNGDLGNPSHPEWLMLELVDGGLTLNSGVQLWGSVRVLRQQLTLNRNARLVGEVWAKDLTLNSGSEIDAAGGETAPADASSEGTDLPSEAPASPLPALEAAGSESDGVPLADEGEEKPRALVMKAAHVDGTLVGDLQQMLGESVVLNSSAQVQGDWYLPGSPTVVQNGAPVFGGVVVGEGAESPSDYTFMLNSGARVGHLVSRTDPRDLPLAAAPAQPAGSRRVIVNRAGEAIGDFATLRDLTLNSNAGFYALPHGTYGSMTLNSGSGLQLGTEGATEPEVYEFQRLTLNSQSRFEVQGPVVVRVQEPLSVNANLLGNPQHPEWLRLEAQGSVTLNSGSRNYAIFVVPNGQLTINSQENAGNLAVNRLTINSGGRIGITVPLDGAIFQSNQPPIVEAQYFEVEEDMELVAQLVASDADEDVLTYAVVSSPAHGALTVELGGVFHYVPAADFNGVDQFVFEVSDGEHIVSATAAITVLARNDPPQIDAAAFELEEDTPLVENFAATDPDGDSLLFSLLEEPSHGQATVSATGVLHYSPAQDFFGYDALRVQVTDGVAVTVANVTLEVHAVNDPPTASIASFEVLEDQPSIIPLVAADVDEDELELHIVEVTHGRLEGDLSDLWYVPDANYHGTARFVVQIVDGNGGSVTLMQDIVVQPQNDIPYVENAFMALNEDEILEAMLSASDVDGDALVFSLAQAAQHGDVSLLEDGSFSYAPIANFAGSDYFTFNVSDGDAVVTRLVSLSIHPVNDAPVVQAMYLTTDEDVALHEQVVAYDVDGDLLSYTIAERPSHGDLILQADGAFVYYPATGYAGDDRFTVRVMDGKVTSDAVMTVVVNHVNHPPVITSTPVTTMELPEDGSGVYLLGTFRDFSQSHPDMQRTLASARGLVLPELGVDGTPVLNEELSQSIIQDSDSFFQWYHDVPGVNETAVLPLFLSESLQQPGVYEYGDSSFFPLNGRLLSYGEAGENRYFTMNGHSRFTYRGGEIFKFRGDDDVWVFIDGQLVVDLGGVHGPIEGSVQLDTLGLTLGETYDFDIFFAERFCCGSNFFMTTSLEFIPPAFYQHRVTAQDPDGDAVTFRLVDGPTGMEIDPVSGVIVWTPTTAGTYHVVVEVTDGQDGVARQEYDLNVALPVDTKPRFISQPPSSYAVSGVCPRAEYRYFPVVEDVDAAPSEFLFQLLDGPLDAVVDPITGLLTFTVTDAAPDLVPISIMVRDADDQIAIQEFTVQIENRAPAIKGLAPVYATFDQADIEHGGKMLWLDGQVSDDGSPEDVLASQWRVLDGPTEEGESPEVLVSFDDDASPATIATFLRPGAYVLELSATDGMASSRKRMEVRLSEECQVELPDGLIALWTGNAGSADAVGGLPLEGGDCTSYTHGLYLGGFEVHDVTGLSADVTTLAETVAETGQITVEFWAKLETPNQDGLFKWGNFGVYSDYWGGQLTLFYPKSTGTGRGQVSVDHSQGWHHLAAVLDSQASTARLYLDGIRKLNLSSPEVVAEVEDLFWIGQHGNMVLNGMVDEVAIYKRALNEGEIRNLFYAGGRGRCPASIKNAAPVVDAGMDQESDDLGVTLPLQGSVTDDGLPADELQWHWSAVAGPVETDEDPGSLVVFDDAYALEANVSFRRAGVYVLELEASDGLTTASDQVTIRVGPCPVRLPSSLVALWTGNQGAEDSLKGLPLTSQDGARRGSGRYLEGFRFEGDQSYEADASGLAAAVAAQGQATVEFWFQRSGTANGLFCWGDWGLMSDYSGTQLGVFYAKNGASTFSFTSVSLDDEWHHVALTLDEAQHRTTVYLDGTKRATLSAATLTGNLSDTLQLGVCKGRRLKGGLDEFSVYDRVLTDEQIAAIYRDGSLEAVSKLAK
ncbi:MAG: repeat-containing protein [Puniceicoccaceae bacterium 5H]|nr:MAG: repeat-containing protein [Puniceicoccaceae bacterium 5H]